MCKVAQASLVGNLFLNPPIQTSLDGKAKSRTHAAKAGLVVVTTSLILSARHAVGTDAAILKPRSKHRKADCPVVLAARARSQHTTNGCSTRGSTVGRVAVGDARRLAVARDGDLLGNVEA